MLHRVFGDNEKYNKSYQKVRIDDEWLYYPNFMEWIKKQPNYLKWKMGGDEWSIDKDILSSLDDKIYSSNTCCLVPKYINNCVIENGLGLQNKKDKLPQGIYKNHNRYYFKEGKKYYTFGTVEEASKAYIENRNRIRKEMAIKAFENKDITELVYKKLMDDNFIYR